MGLMKYTWNSVEIPDYIENAHSLICTDIYQNLELTQFNAKEIYSIVSSWCDFESDIFRNRDPTQTSNANELEEKQMLDYLFNNVYTLITLHLFIVHLQGLLKANKMQILKIV